MSDASGSPATDPRVAELEQQVAALQRQLGQAGKKKPSKGGSKGRTALALVLIVLACVLAPLSVVSVWARGEVSDTDRYVATVAPLASDPAVRSAVSNRVTEQVLQYVDIGGLTDEAITTLSQNRDLTQRQQAALTALAGPLNSGIESFIRDKVAQIIASDAFEAAWVQANTRAHSQVNAALSGDDSGAVSLQEGQIVLNVGDIVAQVKQQLVDRGFTVAQNIPTVDAQIVVYQSDQIASVQLAYSALNAMGFWLPFIAVAIAVAGVVVANKRRTAVIGLGVGLFAVMLLSGVALRGVRLGYLNALPDTVNSDAATSFFDAFTYFLRQALWAGAAAGAVLILAGLLTGPTRLGVGVRSTAANAAAAVQRLLESWGLGLDSVRRWVAAQATGLRIAATVGALGVLLLQRYKTIEGVLWTTAGLLVVLFVIQVLASGDDVRGEPASAQASNGGQEDQGGG